MTHTVVPALGKQEEDCHQPGLRNGTLSPKINIPALERQRRAELSEFKASLFHRSTSRTAGLHRESLFQTPPPKNKEMKKGGTENVAQLLERLTKMPKGGPWRFSST